MQCRESETLGHTCLSSAIRPCSSVVALYCSAFSTTWSSVVRRKQGKGADGGHWKKATWCNATRGRRLKTASTNGHMPLTFKLGVNLIVDCDDLCACGVPKKGEVVHPKGRNRKTTFQPSRVKHTKTVKQSDEPGARIRSIYPDPFPPAGLLSAILLKCGCCATECSLFSFCSAMAGRNRVAYFYDGKNTLLSSLCLVPARFFFSVKTF